MRRHSKIVWFYGLEGIDLTHQKAQQFHAVLCTEHTVPIAVGCCFLSIRSQHNASACTLTCRITKNAPCHRAQRI